VISQHFDISGRLSVMKAEPELVVDEDAVLAMCGLPGAASRRLPGGILQIVEACGGIRMGELAKESLRKCHRADASQSAAPAFPKTRPAVSQATKRPDRTATLPPPGVGTVKRGTGERRSRADMAWLACVLPLQSATPVNTPARMRPCH